MKEKRDQSGSKGKLEARKWYLKASSRRARDWFLLVVFVLVDRWAFPHYQTLRTFTRHVYNIPTQAIQSLKSVSRLSKPKTERRKREREIG